MIQYQLIRSKRKTISISFDKEINIVVKAPYRVSKLQIDAFVKEKEDWIIATQNRLFDVREKKLKEMPKLISGDTLPFLGQMLFLTVIREERKTGRVKLVKNRLIIWVPYDADYEFRRSLVERWYRKQASEVFAKKASGFAKQLNVNYKGISVKDQKSRWGSCSNRGNLNFNYRILMAPEMVCDYVIWHELCHLIHMNHSEEFWLLVNNVCPNYKICKKWLKDNEKVLYQI